MTPQDVEDYEHAILHIGDVLDSFTFNGKSSTSGEGPSNLANHVDSAEPSENFIDELTAILPDGVTEEDIEKSIKYYDMMEKLEKLKAIAVDKERKIILATSKKSELQVLELRKADEAVYAEDTSEFRTETFFSFAKWIKHLRAATCLFCRNAFSIFDSSKDLIAMFDCWEMEEVGCLSPQLLCGHCSSTACPFCSHMSLKNRSWVRVHGKKISWCCNDGRFLLLWILLCGYDSRTSFAHQKITTPSVVAPPQQRTTSADDIKNVSKKRKAQEITSQDSGVGFSSHSSDALWENKSRFDESVGLIQAHKSQIEEDIFRCMILKFLTGLIPALSRNTGFDILQHSSAIFNILLESNILSHCASLLRNDSLEDISTRSILYQDLFSFVTTLGTHPSTMELVQIERPVRVRGRNLLTMSFGQSPQPLTAIEESLVSSMRNLAKQSQLLTKHVHGNEFDTSKGQIIRDLAHLINDSWQVLNVETLEGFADSNPKTGKTATVDPVADVPDEILMATYAFPISAKMIRDPPRGRMRRLLTEIATMNTGLPPGIFVRYASERPDIIKAIIVGPVDTPYENGLFEFDILCREKYPNVAPVVSFKTTNGGTARFNPNLYQDGTVCLSLLGTWTGESWKPGESTILQVLLSIQAMILCENPWYNEPGREEGRGSFISDSTSIAFNKVIRSLTIQHAILPYANSPPELWRDVIEYHFSQNADAILKTAEEWGTQVNETELDDWDFPEGDGALASKLPRLQQAMQKYGSTYMMTIKEPGKAENGAPRRHSLGAMPSDSKAHWNPSLSPLDLGDTPPSLPPLPQFVSDFNIANGGAHGEESKQYQSGLLAPPVEKFKDDFDANYQRFFGEKSKSDPGSKSDSGDESCHAP